MNEINTQRRQRVAAQEKAEADKILKVKAAEADMEAKHLSGDPPSPYIRISSP